MTPFQKLKSKLSSEVGQFEPFGGILGMFLFLIVFVFVVIILMKLLDHM